MSLATMRSIAWPTVQQLAEAEAAQEQRDREDKADQTRHIVRSVSLIYLCALCFFMELFLSSFSVVFAM